MRILCLSLPDLALRAALRVYPELEGAPVVIGGAPSEPRPVIACSPEAMEAGIRPGMRLKEAQARCPEALFLSEMTEHVRASMARIEEELEQVSPVVEAAADGLFFLSLQGMRRLWPREELLIARVRALLASEGPLIAQIGIADTKYAALLAAYEGSQRIVPPGEDADFLHDQPIDLLPAPPSMIAALQALGIDSLGDFAALPPNAVVMRFGKEARKLQLMARGFDDAPVVATPAAPRIETRVAFEGGETARERLVWIIERRLQRLYRQMDQAGLVARALHLTLILEAGRELQEAVPIQDPLAGLPELRRLLRWRMEGLELPAPVDEILLELIGLAPMSGRQLDLWTHRAEDDVRRLLSQLVARWGAGGVVQPHLIRSLRIEASFEWTKAAPPPGDSKAIQTSLAPTLCPGPLLRLLPEPYPVDVVLHNRQPVILLLGRRRERILNVAGPWRLNEGWWDARVERDEYQLSTASAVYYVTHDHATDRWSLLGAFD